MLLHRLLGGGRMRAPGRRASGGERRQQAAAELGVLVRNHAMAGLAPLQRLARRRKPCPHHPTRHGGKGQRRAGSMQWVVIERQQRQQADDAGERAGKFAKPAHAFLPRGVVPALYRRTQRSG
jgi:hypothetical protein